MRREQHEVLVCYQLVPTATSTVTVIVAVMSALLRDNGTVGPTYRQPELISPLLFPFTHECEKSFDVNQPHQIFFSFLGCRNVKFVSPELSLLIKPFSKLVKVNDYLART